MSREKIVLACEDCKRRNYVVTKNRGLTPGRVAFRKYCGRCKRHTTHHETR